MRSRRPGLAKVVSRFEGWRTRKRGRRIPEELLDAAVGLLAEHSATAICRALRLNSSRFKQAREARSGGWSKRGHGGGVRRRDGRTRALKAPLARRRLSPGGGGFVELAAVGSGCGDAVVGPRVLGMPGVATGWRLSLENATGTVTIIMRAPEPGLVDAVRRHLLCALGDGSGA